MRLAELAQLGLPQSPPRVPSWSYGCWRRRSITFANGATDESTRVFWLQTRGLTADLRLPARKFQATSPGARARFEGGLAQTSWDGQKMSWGDWTAFQLHDKWPEPALLTRIGNCLIEFAPSGIYVEDWRLQPSAPGLWAGLRLIEERDLATGTPRHRGGGLIVAGDHAALIKGRPESLPVPSRLDRYVGEKHSDPEALKAAFAFEASYGERRPDGAFQITASTIPEREGALLLSLEGFDFDSARGLVVQHCREGEHDIERIFTVDTLEPNRAFPMMTTPDVAAAQWLEREAETLLRDAQPIAPLAP